MAATCPRSWLAVAVASVLVAGCGGASPPGGTQPEQRLDWAVQKFEAGEWGAAREGLRDFLFNHPLHPLADSAQYLLGEAFYRDERYVESAEAFSRLVTNRPTSSFADDAQLGVCRSYWALSPELPLDQDYTRRAVEECGRLEDFFSDSPLRGDAAEIRREARHKLAAKQYRIAKWYYDRGAYESANIYLEEILREYPAAPVVPEVMATLFRSYRELGFDAEAREVRRRLLEEHPESQPARELRDERIPGPAVAAG